MIDFEDFSENEAHEEEIYSDSNDPVEDSTLDDLRDEDELKELDF